MWLLGADLCPLIKMTNVFFLAPDTTEGNKHVSRGFSKLSLSFCMNSVQGIINLPLHWHKYKAGSDFSPPPIFLKFQPRGLNKECRIRLKLSLLKSICADLSNRAHII